MVKMQLLQSGGNVSAGIFLDDDQAGTVVIRNTAQVTLGTGDRSNITFCAKVNQ